jgi:hypothetical protein
MSLNGSEIGLNFYPINEKQDLNGPKINLDYGWNTVSSAIMLSVMG